MPFAVAMSAFLPHVCKIFGLSSKKEMIGANAIGGVALVAHVHAIRDASDVKDPREAVRRFIFSVAPRASTQVAVPTFGSRARPSPAVFCFVNVFPEKWVVNNRRHSMSPARLVCNQPSIQL